MEQQAILDEEVPLNDRMDSFNLWAEGAVLAGAVTAFVACIVLFTPIPIDPLFLVTLAIAWMAFGSFMRQRSISAAKEQVPAWKAPTQELNEALVATIQRVQRLEGDVHAEQETVDAAARKEVQDLQGRITQVQAWVRETGAPFIERPDHALRPTFQRIERRLGAEQRALRAELDQLSSDLKARSAGQDELRTHVDAALSAQQRELRDGLHRIENGASMAIKTVTADIENRVHDRFMEATETRVQEALTQHDTAITQRMQGAMSEADRRWHAGLTDQRRQADEAIAGIQAELAAAQAQSDAIVSRLDAITEASVDDRARMTHRLDEMAARLDDIGPATTEQIRVAIDQTQAEFHEALSEAEARWQDAGTMLRSGLESQVASMQSAERAYTDDALASRHEALTERLQAYQAAIEATQMHLAEAMDAHITHITDTLASITHVQAERGPRIAGLETTAAAHDARLRAQAQATVHALERVDDLRDALPRMEQRWATDARRAEDRLLEIHEAARCALRQQALLSAAIERLAPRIDATEDEVAILHDGWQEHAQAMDVLAAETQGHAATLDHAIRDLDMAYDMIQDARQHATAMHHGLLAEVDDRFLDVYDNLELLAELRVDGDDLDRRLASHIDGHMHEAHQRLDWQISLLGSMVQELAHPDPMPTDPGMVLPPVTSADPAPDAIAAFLPGLDIEGIIAVQAWPPTPASTAATLPTTIHREAQAEGPSRHPAAAPEEDGIMTERPSVGPKAERAARLAQARDIVSRSRRRR